MALPEFDENDNLPAGEYVATWQEFSGRFGTNEHRKDLLEGLLSALQSLKRGGEFEVWLDGSFTTADDAPDDWDGLMRPVSLSDISAIDAVLRDKNDLATNGRPRQKAKYRGEMIPYSSVNFSFFQTDRDGNDKGIVKLDMSTVPES